MASAWFFLPSRFEKKISLICKKINITLKQVGTNYWGKQRWIFLLFMDFAKIVGYSK
jgi:hypothetical protein